MNAGDIMPVSFLSLRGTVNLLALILTRAIKTYERAGFVRYGERRAVSYGRAQLLFMYKQVR